MAKKNKKPVKSAVKSAVKAKSKDKKVAKPKVKEKKKVAAGKTSPAKAIASKPPAKKKVLAKPAAKVAVKKGVAKTPAKVVKKAAAPAAKKTGFDKEAEKSLAKPAAVGKATSSKSSPSKESVSPERVAKKAAKEESDTRAIDEVSSLDVEGATEETASAEEVILTDAEGRRYCRVKDCDQLSTVDGYCRYHYLLFWKKIQIRKKILTEGKLERYIEELTARYPDKFLDMLRKDLRSEKEFLAAIQELEIDESATENEFEDETQTFIEEVRGIGEAGGARDDDDF